MKQLQILCLSAVAIFAATASAKNIVAQPAAAALGRAPGSVFRECPECPEMVVIPDGNFTMGSSAAEKSWAASQGGSMEAVADEAPQHQVSLRSFALGRYLVTRAEYAAFVRETGYSTADGCHISSMPRAATRAGASWQDPGFSQSDRDPVTCVSWQDARAYVAWLNGKVSRAGSAAVNGPYRLPSESEWEYAARAGTTTRFWWGDDDGRAASYAWYKDNSGGRTHPVGSKPANAFGVFDAVGNVWQWTEDCYAESYSKAPADGRADETAKDCLRVDRGGSWLYPAWLLRSATRERNPAEYRDVIMGFRVARTLDPTQSAPAASSAQEQESQSPPPRVVDLKASDGTVLKATYFAAVKAGPGVLLLHQSNRDRKSWDHVAVQFAAAGFNTLTLDMRGLGESGGSRRDSKSMPDDVDTALAFLTSQPGVDRQVIGLGGAGLLGVTYSVEAARRHPTEIKSLVLMSGETFRDGLQFLHQASQLPELFVFSDDDEYPPTQDAMKLLYVTASSPSKKLVHYSAAEDAPWLWYETSDASKVPAHGAHGTDLFEPHPELPGIIAQWFVTTLIKTPGHAPADTLAAASLLNQLQTPGGAVQVKQQLVKARKKDPQVQLWPEVAVDIIGEDYQRAGDIKNAIEVFQLNLLAYPDSADANDNLANAYLADGQKELARRYAEKALALLDSHKAPASSWSDTEPRRDEIRRSAQRTREQAIKGPVH